MESRTLTLLEFPKILDKLADMAVSESGRSACLDIRPSADAEEVARGSLLLADGLKWASESGFKLVPFPPLGGLLKALDSPVHVLDNDALFALAQMLDSASQARLALAEEGVPGALTVAQELLPETWPEGAAQGLARCLDPEGRIRDEASPELYDVRSEVRAIHQRCTRKVKDYIRGENLAPYLQDEYMTISSDRYVVPLKTNFKGRLPGVVHDYSQTGETCYFEPMFLVELNNELQELKRLEREAERKVMAYLTGLVRQDEEAVAGVFDMLVALDVLLAKASLASAFDGLPVETGPDAPLNLRAARHPLLAASRGGAKPLDVTLPHGVRGLIVSGGNAGGKTVCLKTVGLTALMAASGLPAPVGEGSTCPLFAEIFVVMGDEQSLEDMVSTFTAQIRSIARIWDRVDENALFILDEFGAGTDPAQGAALAQALVESIMDKGARVMAATHFPALKAYALAGEKVRAASMLFDPDTLKPLYKLVYDQVGASIALDVARDFGLPAEILARAEKYLLMEDSDAGALMDRLNRLAVRREEEAAGLARERARLKDKRKRLDERYAKEKVKVLDDVRSKSQEIVRQWQKGRLGRKKARADLANLRESLIEKPAEVITETQALAWEDLKPGLSVRYVPWEKKGGVRELDERKGQVKIDMDGVVMWVDFADLALEDAPAPAKAAGTRPAPEPEGEGPALVIDLRGRRADEAVAELAAFLDSAVLRGAYRVEIVHGRGTGALRREVHEFLGGFPAVKRFALADEEHGGDGMTMAELI